MHAEPVADQHSVRAAPAMPQMVSLLPDLEPAFVDPLFTSTPELLRQPLVALSCPRKLSSRIEQPHLLTGTISAVQHRSNSFWIKPDPSQGCSVDRVFSRLEHVTNEYVTTWDLFERKVISFRLGEGEVKGTFEAFDVCLDDIVDHEDKEELLLEPDNNPTGEYGKEHAGFADMGEDETAAEAHTEDEELQEVEEEENRDVSESVQANQFEQAEQFEQEPHPLLLPSFSSTPSQDQQAKHHASTFGPGVCSQNLKVDFSSQHFPSGFLKRFECKLCRKVLNSEQQLEQHLNGKSHAEAVATAGSCRLPSGSNGATTLKMPAASPAFPVSTVTKATDGSDMLQSNDPWARALISPRGKGLTPTAAYSCESQCANAIAASTILAMRICTLRPPELSNLRLYNSSEVPERACTRSSTPSARQASVRSGKDQFSQPREIHTTFDSPLGFQKRSVCTPRSKVLTSQKQLDEHLSDKAHAEVLSAAGTTDNGQDLASDEHGSHSDWQVSDTIAEACVKGCDWTAELAEGCVDSGCVDSVEDDSYQVRGQAEVPFRRFYVSDEWDPYHCTRVVDSAHFSAHPELLSDDSPENRRYCVLRKGNLNFFVNVSDNALDEIKARSEHSSSGDKWTRKSLRTYLSYRWIRLLEQGRVLHLFASTRKSPTCMEMFEQGYSQHVVLFHTGLSDVDGEPIFAVMVQDLHNKGKYLLLRSGIHSMVNRKLPEWWCRVLKCGELHVNCPSSKLQVIDSLMSASYHQARDQRLLFDPSLEVKLNSHRIVEQNLDRLILGGVDVEEGWYRDRAETDLPDESNWRFLCYKGKKIRELKYDHSYNSFFFSRGNLGKKSVETLVKQWQQDSVNTATYNFSLAVPQFYYKLVPLPNDERKQVYVGRLQLLLPLFCDNTTPKLALSIQYQDGATPYYFSATVLTISMANNNARQIATPQVPWIQLIDEEGGLDEDEF